ncbi:hypothetical protein VTN49DRAFT_5942 [Thermomyces lanuginosus]|uniref:uncharacterized protein n=1 Tax=Thermomyces lanuginosus TaxID=5541 RepID=UPI0037429957
MSEPTKDSVPTSADPKSQRPKKRRQLTAISEQASEISHLFKDPNKEIKIPPRSKPRTADSLPPPPEIVPNVQGSSAGAGSGEFHVYKASRRREYERLRLMEEEVQREKADAEFQRKREELRRKDEEKTEKNRRKREKKRAAAARKKAANAQGNGTANGSDADDMADGKQNREDGSEQKARLGPRVPRPDGDDSVPAETDQHAGVEEQGVIIHDED